MKKIGIIGAMNEEIVELKSLIEGLEEEKIGNLIFFKGKIKNKDIILVECGIGKVNAGICATLLCTHFKVDKVLFTGVAGGLNPELNIGDIVIGEELLQWDFDCTAFGYELGQIPRMDSYKFLSDKNLIKLACEVAIENFGEDRVKIGKIISADYFVASAEKINWLREKFMGDCTEMEGASVAQVCHIFKVPFLIIRALSDKANSDAKMDFPEFVKLAAKNSKLIVENMLEKI